MADSKKVKIAALPKYYYTGSQIQPRPEVTVNGVLLREGVDYSLAYEENTKVGKGSVTVIGNPEKGYIGSRKLNITILPKWLQWLFR